MVWQVLALSQSGIKEVYNEGLILEVNLPQLKYEFDVEFDIPVTYPMTSPEIALPELDGKTAKVKRLLTCMVKYLHPLPCSDVQRGEDLPHRPLQASVGQKCSQIWQVCVI